MKKIIKGLALILCVLLIGITVPSKMVKANTLSENLTKQKKVITQYLNALKSKDTSTIIKLSDDIRYKTDSEYTIALNELFQDEQKCIKSYSLDNGNILNKDTSFFNVHITYGNNDIQDIKLNVTMKSNNPVVIVGQEVYEDGTNFNSKGDYNSMDLSKSNNIMLLARSAALTRFTKYLTNGSNQYTNKFNCGNSVFINVRQYSSSNLYYGSIHVEYAIVKYGIIVDTVYAKKTLNANDRNHSQKIYLGPGKFSGAQLRFKNTTLDSRAEVTPATIYGEIYNN